MIEEEFLLQRLNAWLESNPGLPDDEKKFIEDFVNSCKKFDLGCYRNLEHVEMPAHGFSEDAKERLLEWLCEIYQTSEKKLGEDHDWVLYGPKD